jgi:hypothetical protein
MVLLVIGFINTLQILIIINYYQSYFTHAAIHYNMHVIVSVIFVIISLLVSPSNGRYFLPCGLWNCSHSSTRAIIRLLTTNNCILNSD